MDFDRHRTIEGIDTGHPMITKAHLEPMAKTSKNWDYTKLELSIVYKCICQDKGYFIGYSPNHFLPSYL